MAVVRSGGDARAAKLILVILLVENVPLLAAFEDCFFLRSDSLAHFQLDLLFVFQRGRQNLHHLLPNGVAVVDEFHFLALNKHIRDLVRQPYNFFAGQAHRFWKSSFAFEIDTVKPPVEPGLQALCRPKPETQQARNPLPHDHVPVPVQLLLHFLVHLLIRDAGPAHFILMVDQDLPHFLVEPVLDRQLFKHPQPDAVSHSRCGLGFDMPALDQPFHNFVSHVRYIVSYDQHLSAFPLRQCKRVSLLAAPIKCKETRKFTRKNPPATARLYPACSRRNVAPRLADPLITRELSASQNAIIRLALTLLAASCTMIYVRALSSAVRAFGLHPKGRPFKSDSAHHCDATPFSGDVVQLVRTLPCHGRGREFESRRPRHSLQPITVARENSWSV